MMLSERNKYENAEFYVDATPIKRGSVLITSDDAAFLQAVRSKAILPEDYSLCVEGNQMKLALKGTIILVR